MNKIATKIVFPSLAIAALLASCTRQAPPEAPEAPDAPQQGLTVDEATELESRDMTEGYTWIDRLERDDRLAGLRIDDVIAALELRDGDVIADIGAGTGAFTIPFARAVAPSGRVLAVDIWQELLDHIGTKADAEALGNLEFVLCKPDDPMLPPGEVDIAFFHDVFHNVPDRQAYLNRLASYLKPEGRIAIIEQEFDDPIAARWDVPENRITREQVERWMSDAGFELEQEFDLFQGGNNPPDTGMPERWFVVYARAPAGSPVEKQ